MNIGTKILKLREFKKLTQEDLASLIGVSQVTIGNWEQGKSIKHDHLNKLSEILDVPVEQLLDEKGITFHQENNDTAKNNINGYEVCINIPQEVIDGLFDRIDKLILCIEHNSK